MKVNRALLLAAAFTVVFLLAHVFVGGARYHAYFNGQPIDAEQKALFTVLWHAFSLHLLLSAGALFAAATRPEWWPAALLTLFTFTAYLILDLVVGVMTFGAPWPLLQWVFLLPICVALLVGVKRDPHPSK